MKSKKKAAGLDALKHLSADIALVEKNSRKGAQGYAKKQTEAGYHEVKTDEKPSSDKKVFTLLMPTVLHDKLRELAYHERSHISHIIFEGLDMLFEKKGIPPIDVLVHDEK